ncbi:ABC transporter integral membrane type 1 [Penicillium verhagenii]|nr:ABC transporter integral membrane type 1 [Penicillium verhagenii]
MASLSQSREQPAQKRRKIRKGTSSCWECKNRKIRCQFNPSSATICASCQRRGLSCISQQYPSHEDTGYQVVEQRISYVEGLVAQLVQHQEAFSSSQISPVSQEVKQDLLFDTIDPTAIHLQITDTNCTPENDLVSSGSLSHVQSILPSATILNQILDRSPFCNQPFYLLICSKSLARVDRQSKLKSNQQLQLAHTIIQLALCLQQPMHQLPELQFDQPSHQVAHYFIKVASRYITSQDSLIDSLDGLETLILEARYHIHVGNLHSAWLLFRRALEIARSMGVPCRRHETESRAESIWFRLIYSDRFLSLMLGLPFVDVEGQLTGARQLAADEWSDRLERTHVTVVGKIITRNLYIQQRNESNVDMHELLSNDYQETRGIDLELKRAGRMPPIRWWVSPVLSLGHDVPDLDTPERFIKILTQMHQAYLIVVLHQPYLLEHIRLKSTPHHQIKAHSLPDYTYSKQAVLGSSREVLAHFCIFHDTLQNIPYLGLVEKAFASAVCLLQIHMNEHRLKTENALEHQRFRDLAVIDEVIQTMEKVSSLTNDNLTPSCVEILSNLVHMEECAANGAKCVTWLEPGTPENGYTQAIFEHQKMSFTLPYFGRLHILLENFSNTTDFPSFET